MPDWLLAGLWGWLAGAALVLGAAAGWFLRLPQRVLATVMAFGSGVLISALAFELMDEAAARGGLWSAATGFLAGALVYTGVNVWLARRGGRHRKRSRAGHQPSEAEHGGSGMAIAVGSLLDGIPESIAIGTSMLHGGAVSYVTVAAIFLSNVPEGLSSAAGMRAAGRPKRYVFGLWAAIATVLGFAALAGFVLFDRFSPQVVAGTTAVAAGAILSMLVDTMIPEAFEVAHDFAGLVTVVGFLSAFVLSRWAGG